jgi:hypothetical protein
MQPRPPTGNVWEPVDTAELLWAMQAPLPSEQAGAGTGAGASGDAGGAAGVAGAGAQQGRATLRAGLQLTGGTGPGSGPAAGPQPPRLMVDVGANVGWFTAVAGARGYDVYAFEGGPSARPRAPPMLPATRRTACRHPRSPRRSLSRSLAPSAVCT